MICFGATDKGLVREVNQDSFAHAQLADRLLYAVLCDGMGGENAGNVASELTVRDVGRELSAALPSAAPDRVESVIRAAVTHANMVVHKAAAASSDLRGMGTTVVVLVAMGSQVWIGHAGDSRAYLLRDGELTQLTHDHTVVQMLMENGEITQAEALVHPQRHYITRAVGVDRSIQTELVQLQLQPGDSILLCSDGLYNYAAPERFPGLMHRALAEGRADCFIAEALAGGGGDNITAVLIADGGTEDRTDG